MSEAIFIPDGDAFVPTEHALGPWDENALHGGAPGALMARAIERVESDQPMFVARLTFEFLRPVPLAPLHVATRVVRPGRRVQLVEATTTSDGTEVARAVALRIRVTELSLPTEALSSVGAPAPPEEGQDLSAAPWRGFGASMDVRLVAGKFFEGPTTVWFRLRRPLVAGEDPTPLMRVVAAADFGNGISSAVSFFEYLFINPDLTVYLHRELEGEWVCLDAVTAAAPHGVGVAQSALYDRQGVLGRSLQALFIDQRAETR